MIRLGIISPSEIAFRRFMPALQKVEQDIKFVGIAVASPVEWFGDDVSTLATEVVKKQQIKECSKAQDFVNAYGGRLYNSYESLIKSNEIDAVYIPLPPALHYKWARMALEYDKHVFVEKPSTINLADTDDLIRVASEKGLALHENYMFLFHSQIQILNKIVESGEIGEVRLYRITFGFPRRAQNDFRYNKKLGGGALFDAGGYTIKYAAFLLGKGAKIVTALSNHLPEFEVDISGSATMLNDEGIVAQLAFGMDNDYKCDIEIWGSKGTITSNRIFTAPVGFTPSYIIKKNQDVQICELPPDDAFYKSIMRFQTCISDENIRMKNYEILHLQESLIDQFIELSKLD